MGKDNDDHRERDERECLSESISALAQVLLETLEHRKHEFEWHRSHHNLATKQDLKESENRIMAVLTDVVADLKEAIASAKQTNLDIADAQKKIDALIVKVKELEDAIAAGGTSQELADLAKEVKTLTKAADDALPNPIVVPPVPV